ncbi:MAG: hypothetical protein H0U76_23565 [Ktedonobacteraceae bacterium]|nr:hypothetical protein [Ktedonobacteraceae bacterium]
MAQYEHLMVLAAPITSWSTSHISVWKPRYIGDEELSDWKNGPDLPTYCNQMSTNGWEVVSHCYDPGGQINLLLKRQVQQE